MDGSLEVDDRLGAVWLLTDAQFAQLLGEAAQVVAADQQPVAGVLGDRDVTRALHVGRAERLVEQRLHAFAAPFSGRGRAG